MGAPTHRSCDTKLSDHPTIAIGICIVANSVVSNRQARAATKAYIKRHLGLELTEAERRALQMPEIAKELKEIFEDLGEDGGAKASAAAEGWRTDCE